MNLNKINLLHAKYIICLLGCLIGASLLMIKGLPENAPEGELIGAIFICFVPFMPLVFNDWMYSEYKKDDRATVSYKGWNLIGMGFALFCSGSVIYAFYKFL